MTSVVMSVAIVAAAILGCARPEPDPGRVAEVQAFVRRYADAWAAYDYGYVQSVHDSGLVIIQGGPPISADSMIALFRPLQSAGIKIAFDYADARTRVIGDVAWHAWTLTATLSADTSGGRGFTTTARAALGAMGVVGHSGRQSYLESIMLHRTPAGWRVLLLHDTPLTPTLHNSREP